MAGSRHSARGQAIGLRDRVGHTPCGIQEWRWFPVSRSASRGQAATVRRAWLASAGSTPDRQRSGSPARRGRSVGQQSGAQPVAVAAGPVDLEPHGALRAGVGAPAAVLRQGRPQRAVPAGGRSTSLGPARQSGRDERRGAVGVGAGATAGQRPSRRGRSAPGSRPRGRPLRSRATAGRPKKHGPHWPADSPASQELPRATSARAQVSLGQAGEDPRVERSAGRAQRRAG